MKSNLIIIIIEISLTDKYQTKTKYPIQSTNNIIKN